MGQIISLPNSVYVMSAEEFRTGFIFLGMWVGGGSGVWNLRGKLTFSQISVSDSGAAYLSP